MRSSVSAWLFPSCFSVEVAGAVGSGRLRNNLAARKVVAPPADTPPAT